MLVPGCSNWLQQVGGWPRTSRPPAARRRPAAAAGWGAAVTAARPARAMIAPTRAHAPPHTRLTHADPCALAAATSTPCCSPWLEARTAWPAERHGRGRLSAMGGWRSGGGGAALRAGPTDRLALVRSCARHGSRALHALGAKRWRRAGGRGSRHERAARRVQPGPTRRTLASGARPRI